MARRNHPNDFTHGGMIGKLEKGHSLTSFDENFGINESVVSLSWKAFQTVATERNVSQFTVIKRIHKGVAVTRRSERCIPMKVGHRRHHLEWCKQHKNWTSHQWSRFISTSDPQLQLI
ncbi:transposable element Tcb2 transposase [Trichonephila clavipes]|nr:transposable element Tcb2 transposase [Trichonephila clavipes]